MKALRRWRGEATDRGASAVEFALVVPFLLLIVFGIINFGAIFAQQIALNNAVRQGNRSAVVSGTPVGQTCGDIVANVQRASSSLALNTANVSVKSTIVKAADGTLLTASCDSGNFVVTTVGSPTAGLKPCVGNVDGFGNVNSLKVEAKYQAKFLVPFPLPFNPPMLQATSVYRCEFNS